MKVQLYIYFFFLIDFKKKLQLFSWTLDVLGTFSHSNKGVWISLFFFLPPFLFLFKYTANEEQSCCRYALAQSSSAFSQTQEHNTVDNKWTQKYSKFSLTLALVSNTSWTVCGSGGPGKHHGMDWESIQFLTRHWYDRLQ